MEESSSHKKSRAGSSGPANESATEQEGRGKRERRTGPFLVVLPGRPLAGLVRMVDILWSWMSLWLLLPKV